MSLGRFIGTVVVILVLYAIVTAPQQAASTAREGVTTAGDAGSSITVFFSSIVDNIADSTGASTSSSSSSDIGDPVYPAGGVETGDGSAPSNP
ncbi:MAG TPA: hypothetical protein VK935_18095 [Actinomycetospora sp.]|nr:hypothetical protein [Actinomycetospora sp.]